MITGLLMLMLVEAPGLRALQADLEALIKDSETRFAIAFHDVASGEEVLIGADVEMHAASTIKVAIMLRLFQLIDLGKLDLEQPVPVHNSFKSIVDGSPYQLEVTAAEEPRLHEALGQNRSLRRLIEAMMIDSSNLATNLLLELADPVATTAAMRSLGACKIQVLRGVQDLLAFEAGRSNTSTAADMLKLVLAVAESPGFSESARQTMLAIMRRCAHREMIAGGIPAGSRAVVANKTGRISSVEHDAAFVVLADGTRYGLVIYCDGIDSEETRAKVLETGRKLSRRVFDYVTSR